MAIAPSVTLVTVTGNYVDFEGNFIQGQVRFTLNQVLRNGTDDQLIAPSSIVVPLSAGSFSVQLPATNDPDVVPNPFTYTVEESFPGGRSYTISLPFTTVGSLDLADLSPTPTLATTFVQLIDETTWSLLEANIDALDLLIDQVNGTILATGKYWYIPATYNTYTDVENAFLTYSDLESATFELTGSDILPFVTSAQGYATQASSSATQATINASATINPLLLIGG
jgi:hypothetical protein